jgi:hypothetical protein
VQGVGLLEFASPTIEIHGNHQIHISYNGSAILEPDAVLDLNFGFNKPGTTTQPTTARLDANIDADHETANVELWFNGKHYKAQGGRPDGSPDHAFSTLVSAMSRGDWGAVYDMAAPIWRSYATRDQFISKWSAGWKAQFGAGPVQVRLTGEPALNDTGLGYWTAYVGLQMSTSKASASYKVTLQSAGSGWLLFDMSAA